MDVYMNINIYNERSPHYAHKIREIDGLRMRMVKLKRDSQERRKLDYELDELEGEISLEKILRGLLLYLIEKTDVRVLNRSFVKPPPRMNFMLRDYRKKTIGIITRNARNERRIQNKIAKWKRAFRMLGTTYHCISDNQNKGYYKNIPN